MIERVLSEISENFELVYYWFHTAKPLTGGRRIDYKVESETGYNLRARRSRGVRYIK